jgi:hypothetical protein
MARYNKSQNDKTGHLRGMGTYSGGPVEHSTDPVYDQLQTGKRRKADSSTRRGYDDARAKRTDWSRGK